MSHVHENQSFWCSLTRQSFFVYLLFFGCLVVASVDARAEDSRLGAQALFELSGLKELLVQIPHSTASSFEATLTSGRLPEIFDDVEHDSIKTAVQKSFVAETFNKHLTREIDQSMSQASIAQMLTWYASPLGSRVKRAEMNNSLLTEQTRFEAFQDKLANTGVTTRREQLIYQLDEAMHSTDSAVDMMGSVQIAFNLSLSRFLPEAQRLSQAEIRSLVNQNHGQLLTQYRNQTREVLLFTYQEFDNDELQLLSETLETVAGKQFVAAINNGIKKGMFAASLDLGDNLGALLGDHVNGPGI